MDIRCPICLEPWDMDTIHDEVSKRYPDKSIWHVDIQCDNRTREHISCSSSYSQEYRGWYCQKKYEEYYLPVKKEFNTKGCGVAFGIGGCEPSSNKGGRSVIYALQDIMGDDIDGLASSIEDAEMMGFFD